MDRSHTESSLSRRSPSGVVGLLGSLISLAFGVRIAAAITRSSLGRCVLEGLCDGIVDAALRSPGTTLLGLAIVAISGVPLFLWLPDARGSAEQIAELSDLARKVAGYFAAAFAVGIGTMLVLEGTAWWSVSVAITLWIIGFVVVTVSFRGDRRAQVIYVLAVIGFPVFMTWLLEVPVVS